MKFMHFCISLPKGGELRLQYIHVVLNELSGKIFMHYGLTLGGDYLHTFMPYWNFE